MFIPSTTFFLKSDVRLGTCFFDSLVKYCSDRPVTFLSVCQRLDKHTLLFDSAFHSNLPGPTSVSLLELKYDYPAGLKALSNRIYQERERERERETERGRDRETETQREADRDRHAGWGWGGGGRERGEGGRERVTLFFSSNV